ncbi:MAG TPA: OB-fold domain-containing protein [Acidimicrobiales bacterium]|nr:OB-fold domain-containing protein [Acidimicrobiales bacterium]
MAAKTQVPAVEGWFTLDPDRPALLGSRCRSCGIVCFPREASFCRNPACTSREFDEVELSRTGTLWSFTDNRYQPPEPYVSADPFEPYAIAAVELAAEKMVVLGQLVAGTDITTLRAGQPVELVLGTLYSDDEHDYLVWKWRPVADGDPKGAAR